MKAIVDTGMIVAFGNRTTSAGLLFHQSFARLAGPETSNRKPLTECDSPG